ncbi:MAG TPA: hypothetical protein VND64_32570 [Pirellulales bacterium]|nr:hypothetical protein [Pirellulales bacterium]
MIYQRRRFDGVGDSGQMAADALQRFAQRDPDEQDLIIRLARIPILDPKVPKREREIAEVQARQLEQVRRLAHRPHTS